MDSSNERHVSDVSAKRVLEVRTGVHTLIPGPDLYATMIAIIEIPIQLTFPKVSLKTNNEQVGHQPAFKIIRILSVWVYLPLSILLN